tara:strand:- start:10398 stop:10550 length:153 start_codon:yes stop_codon:yes gene_type:complete
MLADRLKKTIEEILQMTTLEKDLWAGYFLHEYNESKKTMGKQATPVRRRR